MKKILSFIILMSSWIASFAQSCNDTMRIEAIRFIDNMQPFPGNRLPEGIRLNQRRFSIGGL